MILLKKKQLDLRSELGSILISPLAPLLTPMIHWQANRLLSTVAEN
jgi:hypothetical protein